MAETPDLNIDLLKRLCETPGVPGHEDRVRDLITAEAEGLFDVIERDAMGSLLCKRHGKGESPQRVMLLCHMDEIGFLVSHVTEKGFVYVQPVGGFDPRNLFSRRVRICARDGDLLAVMNPAGKPVHIATPEEKKKVPDLADFYLDTGLGAAAADKVAIGDMVVMEEPFLELGETVVSKALDNRIACWLGLEAARAISDHMPSAEITVAFTCQEEVGLRGARTAAFAVRPDIGIGVDTTLACDTPGTPDHEAVTRHGKGFGLHMRDGSFIADRALVETLAALADAQEIPYQRTMLRAGGQDGAAAQQAAAGARAATIAVGTRYIHTVTEMIHKTDMAAARDILAAYLRTL